VQSGNTQPPSRTARALRWAGVTTRLARPTSNGWLGAPPRTGGSRSMAARSHPARSPAPPGSCSRGGPWWPVGWRWRPPGCLGRRRRRRGHRRRRARPATGPPGGPAGGAGPGPARPEPRRGARSGPGRRARRCRLRGRAALPASDPNTCRVHGGNLSGPHPNTSTHANLWRPFQPGNSPLRGPSRQAGGWARPTPGTPVPGARMGPKQLRPPPQLPARGSHGPDPPCPSTTWGPTHSRTTNGPAPTRRAGPSVVSSRYCGCWVSSNVWYSSVV
jgi:hypothetical protein